jgi:arsenate reductase (glutaredoxin)
MAVVIWHNPKCGTSRKVLAMIEDEGIKPNVVDYVKTPPSIADIKAVLRELTITPRDLLRRRGGPYDELGLDDPKLTDTKLIEAMHRHPLLIERPVVRTRKGTRLCRPAERVREIL